jgi:hypothetical protein
MQQQMPCEYASVTHKFRIGSLKGYLTVGFCQDGRPSELFITVDKVGTFERGMAHAVAQLVSAALQHGVPLAAIVEKLRGMRFEPAGKTTNDRIPFASSLCDYIARWLELKFLGEVSNGRSDNAV